MYRPSFVLEMYYVAFVGIQMSSEIRFHGDAHRAQLDVQMSIYVSVFCALSRLCV